jgi:hypothetical protein
MTAPDRPLDAETLERCIEEVGRKWAEWPSVPIGRNTILYCLKALEALRPLAAPRPQEAPPSSSADVQQMIERLTRQHNALDLLVDSDPVKVQVDLLTYGDEMTLLRDAIAMLSALDRERTRRVEPDYVSRQAVIEALERQRVAPNDPYENIVTDRRRSIALIQTLPAVEGTPKEPR